MIGFAWHPAMAFHTGGMLTLLMSAVLYLKGRNAVGRPYKHTELWVMLPRDLRPAPEVAQQLIGNVLRDVYFRFAQHTAALSALMLAIALLLLSLFGVSSKYL